MPATWNDEQMCRLRNSGMVGLITVTGCGRAAFLGERAKQMHLPHLALVRQNCEHLETGFPGDFFSDRDSMIASYVEARDVDVVISKTEDEGFTDILVLYDEKFALYGMELLMRRVQRSNVTFSYLRLSPDRKLVKRGIETIFRSQAERNSLYSGFGVLVFSNYTLAEQLEADLVIENNMDPNIILLVFYNGWDLGLNSWYYTRVTSYPYEKLIHVILRSFPRNVRNRMKRVSYALDGKYHVYTYPEMYAANFVAGIMEHLLLKTPNLSNGSRCDSSQDMFYEVYRKDLKVLMESWGFRRDEANYTMLLLSPVEANTTKMKHIQDWTITNGTIKTVVLRDRVSAFLQNRTIKLASLEYPPFIVLNRTSTGERKTDGTFLRLMAYLGSIYGFRVEYLLLENTTSMGTLLGDYNWTGCLGMLNHREIDWVAFLDITEVRKRSFSLTDGFMSNTVGMMVQAPRIETRKLLFLKPFENEVWLTILISLPTMSVVLWIIARTSPAHAQLGPDTRPAGLVKFFNCVWYLYGALLQQGGVHLPAASSARIILGFWWLYVLVVMAYYSSNLIAFLTVPEIHWIVSSFKNAVDREDLYIYVPYGTGLHQEIDNSTNLVFRKLKNRLQHGRRASLIHDPREIVDQVAEGEAILLDDMRILKELIEKDYEQGGSKHCRLSCMPENIMHILVSIGTRKGSPFINALNKNIFRLKSTGMLDLLLKNHTEHQHPCIRDYSTHAHGTSRPIGVRELEGVFLLLLFGTAISLITVPVELMVGLGRQRVKVQEIFQPASKKERKTPATIDLHRGWKQTQLKDSWTTVGPGGRFMTDRYPDFGRFGRRPIYVKEVPPFPHYRVNWRDAGDSRKLHGHVVVIGNRP
ncbi:glutamate receptor ionotropic, delta-1-like [Ixodes scapularis]|uniref:glutamate receptor ionotropic, delta-1-like n=1 Tax=Ixodes scapularis TaxID=6945 RepID=UPI001C385262|nr:glutamate receptor ionotropic, delta-1-like [Ixodes scapularis]